MPEPTPNNTPMSLSCRIGTDGLQVSHGETLLASEPYDVPPEATSITLSDFEHDGSVCRVNAFTIGDGGVLEPWVRTVDGASWPLVRAAQGYDLHVVVVPVAHEPAGGTSGRIASVFQPDSWHTLVHVYVPTDGTKPPPGPPDGAKHAPR